MNKTRAYHRQFKIPTATRASVYGGEKGGVGTDGAGIDSIGAAKPRHCLKPANTGWVGGEGVPKQASAMRLKMNKIIYHGYPVLVSWFVSKLEQTAPVPIPTLHKIRVGTHDQQPERRIPIVDT
ncbi:hypothetical protein SARC_03627 [Sphaeroforma arctica JP610]|uniref:Uncharacterized protein n=1 Tax=Sphaeroforma arctica JP610 TaxID=667725 RepID=A0A0L0G545_9EUKA|nr:hypothetical protein SARC_03627 [Sphaeroforma arctica JP610]KNC84145.1 hypothetical protein SARC_03627 [Sphaeroforma arctica JP610]|eukprot:XP_014158047.1 hypothetical protein SARC_03627 [Sphaeroforma arctica JP610]